MGPIGQRGTRGRRTTTSQAAWAAFDAGGREFWQQMDALVDMLDGVVGRGAQTMPEAGLSNGWTRVAFGDVVQLSQDRVDEPEADGFSATSVCEHIESGDLRIRRWGNIADGTTFTSVFRPGQVLFGKRRAYQRKIAVADFGGVCSGDIYVLEPRNAKLLPELLPFICQTDAFFAHAVGTSAGSLSPRTNWNSLAAYEFALPPLSGSDGSQLRSRPQRLLLDNFSIYGLQSTEP